MRLVIFIAFSLLYFYGFGISSLASIFEPVDKSFKARVHRVVDGDTIDIARFDPKTGKPMRLRLIGIDTPEKQGQTSCPIFANMAQRTLYNAIASSDSQVQVRLLYRIKNRWLARVSMLDGRSLSTYMLEQGHARRYFPTASHTPWKDCA